MTVETASDPAPARGARDGPLFGRSPARILFLARQYLADWADADLKRLSLWAPVAIALGAGAYFGLKSEPPPAPALMVMIAAMFAAAWPGRLRPAALAVMFAALGFAAADFRTAQIAAPQLWRDLGIVETTGRLIAVEQSPERRRFVIAVHSIDGVDRDQLPARARITWRGKGFDAAPGDVISIRAGLSPPPPPAAPGAFDYARQLYFERIGAVGFAVTAPAVISSGDAPGGTFAARMERLRIGLFNRITAAAPGEGGAILAAIVTGKRDAIAEETENALRDAGLAHLLAISGLHMGLATGIVFFVIRFAMAAIEPAALRYPVKKWAAAAALTAGLFYLVLSGGGWSARRAFVMTGIMFAAILVDRRALSLRNVAIAAAFILLTTPEALFHPGFQMSFAAVTALIGAYEWASRRARPDRSFAWAARLKSYAVGLAFTDVIAALATAPYALFHFNRVAIYSLPANMAAMPLMGLWIAPMAIIALALAPLGLDGWAWRASAGGMDFILAIASGVAAWPGAVSITAQWPLAAMLALTFGGLWLCLSAAPWRLAGLAAIPAAMIMVAHMRQPDLFIAADGLNAGVVAVTPEGEETLIAFNERRGKFAAQIWKETVGFEPLAAPTIPMLNIYDCDAGGCVGALGESGVRAAFIRTRARLAEDCARAELVVAFFPVSGADWRVCKAVLIDRRAVWRRGAHSVRVSESGALIVHTAREFRGARPWTGDADQ